jgi:hypothetical protein
MPGPLASGLQHLLFAVASLGETDYEIAVAGAAAARELATADGADALAAVWEAMGDVFRGIRPMRST